MISGQTKFARFIKRDQEGRYYASYRGMTLFSRFQPIFSPSKTVIGYEALLRVYGADGSKIRADHLFQDASFSFNAKAMVDKLSRIIHISNFANSPFRDSQLFINTLPIANEIFLQSTANTKPLMDWLSRLEIKPQQIVVELIEFAARSNKRLCKSINHLRELGFNIAIDDYGTDASNRERVNLIQPNIIKLDKSLLTLYTQGEKQAMLEALKLCAEINAQIVVEGIETEEQFNSLAQLDINMYQGFHLAKPEQHDVQQFVPSTAELSPA